MRLDIIKIKNYLMRAYPLKRAEMKHQNDAEPDPLFDMYENI
jgi:hypothetical protein